MQYLLGVGFVHACNPCSWKFWHTYVAWSSSLAV